MSNLALYLKYRPTHFAELTGQDAIAKTLTRALAADRVAHAYLFTGPRGTGKTTTARLLAKGVNCLKLKRGEPDNTCAMCEATNTGKNLDIIEIDAASNRGIDEIRALRDKVQVAPTRAKYKVYIIDEVHMLTKEAFNALLKTLEEPPAHAVFILATTEPQKVPQTIGSRCQRFDFKPATEAVLTKHLLKVAKQEGLRSSDEAAAMIARQARGSFRDSLSLLDLLSGVGDGTITADLVREILGLADVAAVASLERALAKRQAAEAIGVIREAMERGIAAETFRQALIDYLRTLLLAKAGAPAADRAKELAADWSPPRLTAAVRAYLEVGDLVHDATTPELPLELATLELLREDSDNRRPPQSAITAATKVPTAAPGAPQVPVGKPSDPPAKQPPTLRATKNQPGPSDQTARKLWEQLLLATKEAYSLSVCLQKTLPLRLSKDTFTLAVQSEFFLKKLQDESTKRRVEALCADILGRKVKLSLTLRKTAEADIVDEALQVFAGAQIE